MIYGDFLSSYNEKPADSREKCAIYFFLDYVGSEPRLTGGRMVVAVVYVNRQELSCSRGVPGYFTLLVTRLHLLHAIVKRLHMRALLSSHRNNVLS